MPKWRGLRVVVVTFVSVTVYVPTGTKYRIGIGSMLSPVGTRRRVVT